MRTSVLSLVAVVSVLLATCTDKGGDSDGTASSVVATNGDSTAPGSATDGSGTISPGTATGPGAPPPGTGTTVTVDPTTTSSDVGGGPVNSGPGNTVGAPNTTVPGSSNTARPPTTPGTGDPGAGGKTGGEPTGSGGNTAPSSPSGAGGSGGNAPPPYQGPCDLLSDGCAEAFSMTRAMTASYTGPLFQLGLASDKNAPTLDIGQTEARTVDLTTWSEYCGGRESNCVVSKIYAQIHSGDNDLLPAVWAAPWGPNCSAGGYTCAAKFTIEEATGLPILTTVSPQEYALSNDNRAMGVNGGSNAIGLLYNGKPVPNQVYCCGVFGITHRYNEEDVFGTDFMVALAYGWKDQGGCCIAVNCGAPDSYCVGAEEEENNDLYDYGKSPLENAIVVTQFDPSANAVVTFLNGTQVLSNSPPKAQINAGTSIHLGGGGDLSQPDPVLMREAFITNVLMSANDVTALKTNIEAFYPSLSFQ